MAHLPSAAPRSFPFDLLTEDEFASLAPVMAEGSDDQVLAELAALTDVLLERLETSAAGTVRFGDVLAPREAHGAATRGDDSPTPAEGAPQRRR